ncbi:MAG: AMP-binding protein, partial [Alphaproteobacteria bacterium]|nr:AMP-binding protein [Alphaproteobacteria bacterium]
MLDLSTWIDRWAAHSPDKTAINWGGGQLSYGALAKRIRMLAATLGAEPGDRIAYLGQNSPHLIELVFACARLGAIAVPLNWRLAMDEHRYVLEDCGARTLIYEPNYAETTANLGLTRIKANTWNSAALPRSRGGPDSRVLIVYTSGTTGRPKGAVLDQRALACNAINSAVMHDLTSADRVLTTIPLFH